MHHECGSIDTGKENIVLTTVSHMLLLHQRYVKKAGKDVFSRIESGEGCIFQRPWSMRHIRSIVLFLPLLLSTSLFYSSLLLPLFEHPPPPPLPNLLLCPQSQRQLGTG